MKPRCILFTMAAILFAISCGKTQEEVKPEIKIPTESQAVFSSGISFPENQGNSTQSTVVSFTATESWSSDVTETKASSWLSVQPSSGGAGIVNMSVTAQPNTGEAARSAMVTIKCGTVTKSFTVTQAGNPPAVIAVESVSLDKTELAMVEEEEMTLTATVKPDNATDKTVTWSSSDASIATVEKGKVKAVKEGSATITAQVGEKTAACIVTVSKKVIAVESVTLDKTRLTMAEGEEATLVAKVNPDNATDKTVTWSTSDSAIATVENGKVKALKEGEATITATAGEKSASCIVIIAKNVVAVESITLNKTQVNLVKGESETLVATVKPDNATDKTVMWSSSDADVAIVENGKVTAKGDGKAIIEAKAGDKTTVCEVVVTVPVESIALDRNSISLEVGQSTTLTATVSPEDASEKNITWSTSNASIATVDNGIVKAIAEGTATITAKAGDKSASCTLTVAKQVIQVTEVSLNKTSLALTKGQSETLVATVKPENATNKTVTWNSSNTSIATVDQNGKVTAIAGGSATITAKAGEKSAECAVAVSVPVSSISLDNTTLALEEGKTAILIATVSPEDASDKTVTWSSSNTSIVTVSDGTVTAVKEGEATVMAKAGEKTATCKVTVSKKVIAVTSVTLNKSSLTLNKGESESLVATVKPDDATEKTVTWSSSNTDIATVDSNGLVIALSAGTVAITAKAGDKTASCAVTVNVPVTSVALNKTSLDLKKGESETLTATVAPNDATDKTVTWSTSDATVAGVDEKGKVTALKSGEATITAKAGDKTATCSVTVTTPVESVSLDHTSVSLEEGKTITLVATINPSDADEKTVEWSTSNASVATVVNGVITAVAEGEATITANADGKEASCSVIVKKKIVSVASVVLDKTELSLVIGQSETLSATVKPDDATDKSVTWSTSNASIATVSDAGVVTAKAVGEATITVKSNDGAKTATCIVKVSGNTESIDDNDNEYSWD